MVKHARGMKWGGSFGSARWRFEVGSKMQKQLCENLPMHGVESLSLKMYPIVTFAAWWEERKAGWHEWQCLQGWELQKGCWGAIRKLQYSVILLLICVADLFSPWLNLEQPCSCCCFCDGDSSLIAVQLQRCSSMAYSSLLMAGAVRMESIFFWVSVSILCPYIKRN